LLIHHKLRYIVAQSKRQAGLSLKNMNEISFNFGNTIIF
jgi:hypothetical protein